METLEGMMPANNDSVGKVYSDLQKYLSENQSRFSTVVYADLSNFLDRLLLLYLLEQP